MDNDNRKFYCLKDVSSSLPMPITLEVWEFSSIIAYLFIILSNQNEIGTHVKIYK